MDRSDPGSRKIWSCRLFPQPEEDDGEALESSLRSKTLSFWEDAEALGTPCRVPMLDEIMVHLDKEEGAK